MSENMAVPTRYPAQTRCCTVCDIKKRCSICGHRTLYACSDCRIDFQTTIYVCESSTCRDKHETKCSARLRDSIARLQEERDAAKHLAATAEQQLASARLLHAEAKAERDGLLAVAKGYEQWEADLLTCHEAWGCDFPTITKELWDKLLALQAERILALKKAGAQ